MAVPVAGGCGDGRGRIWNGKRGDTRIMVMVQRVQRRAVGDTIRFGFTGWFARIKICPDADDRRVFVCFCFCL